MVHVCSLECVLLHVEDRCGMPGIGVCVCVCEVGRMAKDIGMTIREGIMVSFLPCLVAFWGFHPYMFFHFF